jgi:DNA mismatch repair ATPase MutS
VGQIDSSISIPSVRKGLDNYCIPVILAEKNTMAKNVYHPLIPDCMEYSIYVHTKSVLLTGSNMSGKTSFIRKIGINVIAGLTLNTSIAEQFSMLKMRVFSAIRISDDLMNDKSYYFEEVLTIREMIDRSGNGNPNLFLLDEIFKGANTIERISAGKAVLSSLAKAHNIVFVSTHDIVLADLLENEFELFHFSEKVDNRTVDFDYKLKEGKLKNRNAIRILEINDYPENIIKEAIELSKEFDKITVAKAFINPGDGLGL